MPIKGLSETKRLPRLGKIHLGIKVAKDGGVEYPKAVDYFVCPPEVQKVFGEKPKQLRILIPIEDEERWASQYYRCYSRTRGLICKGDGETAMRMVDAATGAMADKDSKAIAMKEVVCQGRDCPDYGKQCKEIMNLQFLLPEVAGLGIWQIDTGSINSIRNINSTAELIKRIYGRVAMIPLLLTLESQDVQDPEGKKRAVYVLNLRTNQTLLELMQTASTKQLTTSESEPEMPISDDEVPQLIIPQNQEPAVIGASPLLALGAPPASVSPSKISGKANDPAPVSGMPTGKAIQNLAELKSLLTRHKIGTKEAVSILGISELCQIVDLDEAWQKIKAIRGI